MRRRFSVKNSKWLRPDLILIDGGKGQLSAAVEVIPEGIKTIGIAKRDEQIIIDKTKSGIDKKWFESSETKMMNEVLVKKQIDI